MAFSFGGSSLDVSVPKIGQGRNRFQAFGQHVKYLIMDSSWCNWGRSLDEMDLDYFVSSPLVAAHAGRYCSLGSVSSLTKRIVFFFFFFPKIDFFFFKF